MSKPNPHIHTINALVEINKLRAELEELRQAKPEPTALFLADKVDHLNEVVEHLKQNMSNILARIHRDGGHYEAEFGTGKALFDADMKVAELHSNLDALKKPDCRVCIYNDWKCECCETQGCVKGSKFVMGDQLFNHWETE